MLGRIRSRNGLGRRYRLKDVVPYGLLNSDMGEYSVIHHTCNGLVDLPRLYLSLAAHDDE
jgi:hypothetical protein